MGEKNTFRILGEKRYCKDLELLANWCSPGLRLQLVEMTGSECTWKKKDDVSCICLKTNTWIWRAAKFNSDKCWRHVEGLNIPSKDLKMVSLVFWGHLKRQKNKILSRPMAKMKSSDFLKWQ